MPCQQAFRALASILFFLVSFGAHAHSSRTDFDVQAGSGGLAEFGVVGRVGFTPYSPWYWILELKRMSASNTLNSTGAVRAGTEIGREDRRFSWGIRGQGIAHSFGPSTDFWTGGSLRLRLIPWDELDFRERRDLDHEEREVRAWARDLVAQAAVPAAPIISVDFDSREFRSRYMGETKFGNTSGMISVLYQIRPFWIIVPNFQFFSTAGDSDPNVAALTQLPTNRLIRWGPQGMLSGIAGSPIRSNQLINYLNFSDRIGYMVGLQWVEMKNPNNQIGSLWFGAERKFGLTQEWSVLAGAEWIGVGAPSTGLMSVRIRYQGHDRFIPRK